MSLLSHMIVLPFTRPTALPCPALLEFPNVAAAPLHSLSKSYRSRPAARSEYNALYGLDPTHLAQHSLADATQAVQMRPAWPKAHSRKVSGFALSRHIPAPMVWLPSPLPL